MAQQSRSRSPAEAPTLSPRQAEVLELVLEEYVETAQPVSSRSIATRAPSRVSPATVRSAMAELTDLGLLQQPHTSAGRVPTERAFRRHVDRLLDGGGSALATDPVPLELPLREAGTEELLRRATDRLGQATGQLGFFVVPPADRAPLRHVSFVRLSSERVLAVLVLERGAVQTRVFEEAESDQRTLDRASTLLSEIVAGMTLSEAREHLASAIDRDRARSDALWRRVLALAQEGLIPPPPLDPELYVGDRNPLLRHPEFSDVRRLQRLLATLEERERVMGLLDGILRAEALQVRIGSELGDAGIGTCAVVTAPVGDAAALGSLGVIGPVRMRYDRVIPAVRSLSERVHLFLA